MSWASSGKCRPLEPVLSPSRREAVLPGTPVFPERTLQGQIPAANLSKARTWALAQAPQTQAVLVLQASLVPIATED